MKTTPVDQQVFGYLYPNRTPRDPTSFTHHVQRHLVPEVRREVLSYFGHLDTDEARYPGLDYTNRIHRIRLSRWRHHRDLFRAFDALRLTSSEISGLTRWEGTKWAKDNHEMRRRDPISNTAADHMPHWAYGEARPTSRVTGRPVPPRSLRPRKDRFAGIADDAEYEVSRASRSHLSDGEIARLRDPEAMYTKHNADEYANEQDDVPPPTHAPPEQDASSFGERTAAEESEAMISIGIALNQHLRAQVARHNAGDTSTVMDPEFEAWFAWYKNGFDRPEPGSPTYTAASSGRPILTFPLPTAQSTPRSVVMPSPQNTTPQNISQNTTPQNISQRSRGPRLSHPRRIHRTNRFDEALSTARAGRSHEVPRQQQMFRPFVLSEEIERSEDLVPSRA